MKLSGASCNSIILFSILAENLYLLNFAEYIHNVQYSVALSWS